MKEAADFRAAVPQSVWVACPTGAVRKVLAVLVQHARGWPEVRGMRQSDIAAEAGCSTRTVSRAVAALESRGLIEQSWGARANVIRLVWVSDMKLVTRGSCAAPGESLAPRHAWTNQTKEADERELEEDEVHDRRRAARSEALGQPQNAVSPAKRMLDSPSALARFFESQVRKNQPDLIWTANAPALAARLKALIASGYSPDELRDAMRYFARAELGGQSAYEAMQRQRWMKPVSKRAAEAIVRWDRGGLAGSGYDAKIDSNWPWKFFLSAAYRLVLIGQRAQSYEPQNYIGDFD